MMYGQTQIKFCVNIYIKSIPVGEHSVALRLLGLRVRIPQGEGGTDVSCVVR